MDKLARVLHFVEGAAIRVSMLLLIALVALINVEVFGRYFFSYSTLIADEYGGYLYAWMVLLGGVHLLRSDRYLTMTTILDRLPKRAQAGIGLLGAAVGLAVCVISLISTSELVWLNFRSGAGSGQPSATPIAYPQMAMPVGYALLCLAYVEELLRRALGLQPRRADEDQESYGVGDPR